MEYRLPFMDEAGIGIPATDQQFEPFLRGTGGAYSILETINATNENLTIDAGKITISGSTTFDSGYDPLNKLDKLGGIYNSSSSGPRVRIFPDSNTGIRVEDTNGDSVLKAMVGGTDEGDVEIGDYGSNKGLKWDDSTTTFTVKGSLVMGSGSQLSADYINAGTISADRVEGGTLSGVTVESSDGNDKVVLNTGDYIDFYIGGSLQGRLRGTSSEAGGIRVDSGDFAIDNDQSILFDETGGSGFFKIAINSSDQAVLSLPRTNQIFIKNDDETDNLFTISDSQTFSDHKFVTNQRIEFNDSDQYIDDDEDDDLKLHFKDDCEFYQNGSLQAIIDDNIFTEGDVYGDNKYFIIDHPDGSDRLLRYSAQESPDVSLRHRGRVTFDKNGEATIMPPEHFILVTEPEGEININLTSMSPNMVWVKEIIKNEKFIVSGEPSTKAMFEIIAIRKGYIDAKVELEMNESPVNKTRNREKSEEEKVKIEEVRAERVSSEEELKSVNNLKRKEK